MLTSEVNPVTFVHEQVCIYLAPKTVPACIDFLVIEERIAKKFLNCGSPVTEKKEEEYDLLKAGGGNFSRNMNNYAF